MLFTDEKSRCNKNQKIVVSKDSRNSREHRAKNPKGQFSLRQYKLDEDIFPNEKCCDFLLLNDTGKDAYFIELKGQNIDEAILQLEAAETKCKSELSNYTFYFRIVASKMRTHKMNSLKFRKFQERCGNRLKCETIRMEETLK